MQTKAPHYAPRRPNPAAPVRLHNPTKQTKPRRPRRRNPVDKTTVLSFGLPVVAGGFLATFVVQTKQWIQARTGWDANKMAFAQLAMIGAGSYGVIWALKQPWGRKNRTALLVGAASLLTPLAVDAAATLIPERGSAAAVASTTGAAAYMPRAVAPARGQSRMLAGIGTEVQFPMNGFTEASFGSRPRIQYG